MNSYFSDDTLKQSAKLTGKWEDEVRRAAKQIPDPKARWSTVSDLEIKRLYTPEDIAKTDFGRDIGVPGEFPFLRGNQATGYRGQLLDLPHVLRHGKRARTPTPAGTCS